MENTIHQNKIWVYLTAFLMSFNGGYINAVCLVSILKNAVGYVTGNLTFAEAYLEAGNYSEFFHLLILVLCFLLGSILSGLIIKEQNFKIDRRYQLSLIIQFFVVLFAMGLLLDKNDHASYLLAFIMGMQNAMTTYYGTALTRTTHMTGTTTDLGLLLSHWIKGKPIEFWKVKLYLSLMLGFALGAMLGFAIYSHIQSFALCAPLLIYSMMFALQYI